MALPVGVLAAVKPYSWFDRIASTIAFVGFSLPTFFTGVVFILVPLASHFLWGESLPPTRLLGIAVIVFGVFLVARGG